MSDFIQFRNAVNDQIQKMVESGAEMYTVNVGRDKIWQTYLEAFPEGTNPIFRERTEHDCNCCKNFIRDIGQMVAIEDGKLITVWDIDIPGTYGIVANALREAVLASEVTNLYRHREKNLGKQTTYEFGSELKWDHFYTQIPSRLVDSDPASMLGRKTSNMRVLRRSLEEITSDAIAIVKDLIDQNALYRGEEHKGIVNKLVELKRKYDAVPVDQQNNFLWTESVKLGEAAKIRNTVIGTLLVDLSEGVEMERAVGSFEQKVAPSNYKRTTALITKGMIDKAEKKINELGLNDALYRRHALAEDISVANVLFADKPTRERMRGAFEGLEATAKDNVPTKSGVQEVTIDKFVADILPNVTSMEAYVANAHQSNLMSLVAPLHADSGNILKWDNNFSWSYNGEMTDSIKERVKKAGGSVTGEFRISLSWFNYDDLDIHVKGPRYSHIYYGNKRDGYTGGHLDVDMNVGKQSREAVENVTWARVSDMLEGDYRVYVNNFTPRETIDIGFVVEVEYKGEIQTFVYDQRVRADVTVLNFNYDRKKGITITPKLASTTASKEVWGIGTEKFHKVNMAMLSPNHWDGQEVGNKHWFFILDKCLNPDTARGFYNEFLRNDLTEHRKVFETLGSKLKVEYSDKQLSGLGFSSTQRNELIVRVKGAYNRTLKIKF